MLKPRVRRAGAAPVLTAGLQGQRQHALRQALERVSAFFRGGWLQVLLLQLPGQNRHVPARPV